MKQEHRSNEAVNWKKQQGDLLQSGQCGISLVAGDDHSNSEVRYHRYTVNSTRDADDTAVEKQYKKEGHGEVNSYE